MDEMNEMEIGPQYNKDNNEFKKKARLHQSKFRAKVLKVGFNTYGNKLTDEDAEKGLKNYYNDLNVCEILRERFKNYSRVRDANMLRSEHIPFNFFAPLIDKKEKEFIYAQEILNHFFNNIISRILDIKIEYAPSPKKEYLDDATAFDVYILFIDKNGNTGAIGFEIKYSEESYHLKATEKKNIDNINSKYWDITKKCKLYNRKDENYLKQDDYRQIWRNHILGESIVLNNKIDYFISSIIYPSDNDHFKNIIPKYKKILMDEKKFVEITFENYISKLKDIFKKNKDAKFLKWAEYLDKRYLIKNKI